MEEENKEVGAEATTQNEVENTSKMTFEELLASDKEYQSEYDKKVAQAMKTRLDNERKKWEEEQKNKTEQAERMAKMSEEEKHKELLRTEKERADKAEKTLNAYKLKDETIRQASEKGIPLDLIQTLDFEVETAESIYNKLAIFEKTSKSVREKAINEYSREDPPQTGDKVDNIKSESEMTYEELSKLAKYKD